MNSYVPRYYDLYDRDPNILEDYHQDYREGIDSPFTRVGVVIPVLLCLIPVIYQIYSLFDDSLLPLSELLWNVFVYLTPSRLLDVADRFQSPLRLSDPALRALPRTHAAKCESMRRILGLDMPGGIMGSVAQAGRRRLSTLSGVNLATVAGGADDRPAGLGNWDNSCYQNSVLQGLASLEPLTDYLTSPGTGEESNEPASNLDLRMAEALRGLISTLNDPSNNGRRIWTPATLKNMSSWQQQDAQEYFSKVLDEIDKEMSKVAIASQAHRSFHLSEDPISSFRPESLKTSWPVSRNPLEGLIAQRVGCTRCGFSEGLSMIPFNCLTVPLGRSREYNISECLDEYTKLEAIEGVECGKCTLVKSQRLLEMITERNKGSADDNLLRQTEARLQAINEALDEDDYEEKTLAQKCKISPKSRVSSTKSRQAVIARPPKSLVVHFNRSLFDEMTGDLRKNYSEVRFPMMLDFGPWCLGSRGAKEHTTIEEWLLDPDLPMIASSATVSNLAGPLYELKAVVTHYGRHENGHYICYKKHSSLEPLGKLQKEQWWRLSDDDVMKVSEETVLGQGGVFMLFYDQVEPAKAKYPYEVLRHPTNVQEQEPLELDKSISDEDKALNFDDSVQQSQEADLLAVAVHVPLPEPVESDFSDIDDLQSAMLDSEQSFTTSISEFDDDDDDIAEEEEKRYEPTKPILVTPYVPNSGRRPESGGSVQPSKITSPASLVMV